MLKVKTFLLFSQAEKPLGKTNLEANLEGRNKSMKKSGTIVSNYKICSDFPNNL